MTDIGSNMVAGAVDAMNDVLKLAQTTSIEVAKDLIRMNAEVALAYEPGKGEAVDVLA